MLTIYGVTRSRASRIVWLCNELGQPFRQVPVIQAYRLADPLADDAPLNTLSPEFLRLSPAGAVPVIDDDGLILSESLACTLHLAARHGAPIGPADAAESALMLQWSLYAATAIEPHALAILKLLDAGGAHSGAAQTDLAHHAEQLVRPLDVLDRHLSTHGHLVGGRFTVADLNVAETVRYAQNHHALIDRFAAVKAWLTDCQARPAFRQMWDARAAEPA